MKELYLCLLRPYPSPHSRKTTMHRWSTIWNPCVKTYYDENYVLKQKWKYFKGLKLVLVFGYIIREKNKAKKISYLSIEIKYLLGKWTFKKEKISWKYALKKEERVRLGNWLDSYDREKSLLRKMVCICIY